jgi:hypothetical protein
LRWLGLGFAAGASACVGALLLGGGLRPVETLVLAAAPLPRPQAVAPLARPGESKAPGAQPASALPLLLPTSPAPEPRLVATARATHIYDRPSFDSPRLGYLRAGQTVTRSVEAAGFEGCDAGFFEVAPQGYVCVGDWASIDPAHPALKALPWRPDRQAVLPFHYGMSRFPTPPLYTRIPSYAERASQEPELHYHVRHLGSSAWRHLAFDDVPATLLSGGSAPTFDGNTQRGAALVNARAIPGSGFAFLSLFEIDGYQYGLSSDLAVLPLDRLTPVEPSRFRGLALSEQTSLPVAFVRSKQAELFTGDPRGPALRVKRPLDFREAIPLSGNRVQIGDMAYRETRWGDWIRDRRLVVVEPLSRPPSWVEPGLAWLDVSLLNQTLVAYVGTDPVFVTLVSTGRDGLSVGGTHSTIQGSFLIHTKHVTWNMGSSGTGEAYDLRDVPYVQYFHEGFALHATYWHDAFGSPRSHGCVNLSPQDARWLFEWTAPRVPDGWHGAFGLEGTRVYIHP